MEEKNLPIISGGKSGCLIMLSSCMCIIFMFDHGVKNKGKTMLISVIFHSHSCVLKLLKGYLCAGNMERDLREMLVFAFKALSSECKRHMSTEKKILFH